MCNRAGQKIQIAMRMIHKVLGTIWGGCSQIVLSQAYFPSFPLDFSPMQWKSLHNNHFFQSFKNNFLTLDHTSKAPTKLLFYVKKESIFHKIMKSVFLTTFDISCAKGQKIMLESMLTCDISFQRESFEGKLKLFLHFLGQ